jgi:D-alanine--poly(phosphoribitol) ligase subunit 1
MKFDFAANKFIENSICPNSIAIAGGNSEVKWNEIEPFISKVLKVIASLENFENKPVIIYGHKEAEFCLLILACIKLQITYVPVDTIYPIDRVNDIINQTKAQLLFDCSKNGINFDIERVITKDEINSQETEEIGIQKTLIDNDFVQYILFTSGTTGKPKGVQILRSSLNNYASWCKSYFSFNENSVFLNQAPFTFDVSLSDVLITFSFGGSLILFDRDIQKTPLKMIERIKKYNCSVWTSTPSFNYIFLRFPEFCKENLERLNTFIFMGEVLNKNICKQLFTKFEECLIINGYGPTEATIIASAYKVTSNNIDMYETIPIGSEIQNSTFFIDSSNQNEGELVISGPNVSIGYLNRPELNAEKFFLQDNNRCFRTGDWVSIKDGLIFCKGRIDSQVKLHGYRIELDEISAIIKSFKNVQNVATIALKSNGEVKRIVSFISSINPIEKNDLTTYLKRKLPLYMIPSEIIEVKSFPYNLSGKIDVNEIENLYKKGYYS